MTRLSSIARDVLQQAHYAVKLNRLFITRENLDEKVYREVKEVYARIGGHWNTASQSFLFSYNPTDALAWVCKSGEMPPKNPYAFFQSPDSVVEDLLLYGFRLFRCNRCEGYRLDQPLHECQYIPPNLRILEPSAGSGAIARRVRQLYASLGRNDYVLHCCELNHINRELLRRQGFQVVAEDFLAYQLKAGDPFYNVVLMNPPFQGQTYIEHVLHAWDMTDPDEGTLTAVTSTGFTQFDDPRSHSLYSLACRYHQDTPTIYPAGKFKESGTPVKTVLLPLLKWNLSHRERPWNGYPDWHCATLDFWFHQTEELDKKKWAIWDRIDAGELAGDPKQPEWEKARQLLRPLFAQAINLARKNWVEIEMNEDRLRYMERHFLTAGALECQCEHHTALRQRRVSQKVHRPLSIDVLASTSSANASSSQARPPALSVLPIPAPEEYVQLALFQA